jgi:regulator of protease activity HflC (stomatin/prohibitin superfamily)
VFLAIVVIIIVAKSLVVVPRGKVFVISTLGRPAGVLNAGMNFVTPFVTSIAGRVPIDEQTLDVPVTGGRLRDGTAVVVKGSIRYRVTNPLAAIKDVADYQHALAELARTHWRRALEGSDVTHVNEALEAALPAIRAGAATWGIDPIDATTLMTMSEDGMRELEQRAALERESRVLAWLGERGESPGPDGRPTTAQHAAYKAWSEQLVADHREEIEAAARAAASPFQGADGATVTAVTYAIARTAIPPDGTGRVEANGREWPARNQSSVAILAGFRCIVDRQDSDTLIVRPM